MDMEEEDNYWWNRINWCNKTLKLKRITKTSPAIKWMITTILLLLIMNGPSFGSAEGNVGCHFVKSLCLENVEFCYDDLVFGKCLSKSGVEQEDLDRTPLTDEQSRTMTTMLEEMQGAGLGWDHPFVQCRIQGSLFSMRKNTPLPPNLCVNLAPDPEIIDPQSPLAFVRFTPPNDDYADEVYYPPFKKGFDDRLYVNSQPLRPLPQPLQYLQPPLPISEIDTRKFLSELPEPSSLNAFINEEHERIMEKNRINEKIANRMKDIRNRIELKKLLNEYEQEQLSPPLYINNELNPSRNIPYNVLHAEPYDEFKDTYKRTKPYKKEENELDEDNEVPSTFFREISKSRHTHLNPEEHFSNYKRNPLEIIIPALKQKVIEEDETNDDNLFELNTYPVKYQNKQILSPETSGVYTEGGLVYVPEHDDDPIAYNRKEETKNLLANMLGFTRHERLDVKKPGPLIGPPPQDLITAKHIDTKAKATESKAETKEVLPAHIKDSQTKKATRDHSDEDHAPHTVDTEFAHVYLKNPVDNWKDGSRIVTALADILSMQPYFTHTRVDRHEVSFRVEQNPERKTAVDVARVINDPRTKMNLFRRLGVTVIQAGVGDKIKSDSDSVSASKLELVEEGPDVTHIMAYMFAGAGAAAVVVIVITLLLIRRHDQKKDKLGGLQAGLSGAESCSKDYQELCRARMAGKGASETISSGRITSLSKENDRPPSSRSSTSSWSEEPALTNMDISTGHMVLSYMEDHLRNKGRLQREWEALCRYEAEPSAKEAALQEQCAPFNRAGAPLPYDHSRVVLNHLANAEGLDYINASTITDHDPRAPAYVAAQGPLPTTLSHFWQMIWEQGAVIIVSLCRLQENGEVACARYWPEEGAEVYHIYEVHLVSEHIWCDDYLVRSFYLKNLRTSETRTVTQFHFLSWPQGGIPASAKALLEFRRKVNKSYRGRSCPIVVHGSHGAGRTGAYILLDLVLGRMNKGAREIDIAATLEHLRDQRAGLVATRQQFEFVLMAVAEEVHAILKALPANTQSVEKRELDKEPPVKEEEEESKENVPATASTSTTKKQVKTTTSTNPSEQGTSEKTGGDKDKKNEK